jgi:hypothetical protein
MLLSAHAMFIARDARGRAECRCSPSGALRVGSGAQWIKPGFR